MKPQQPDIEYCIEHKEFVNGLLEKKGGWQVGDWLASLMGHGKPYIELIAEPPADFTLWDTEHTLGPLIWHPSVDDVLAMLDLGHIEIWGPTHTQNRWVILYDKVHGRQFEGRTYLIALLELLKATEEA